jgi:hypothetical protein
MKTPLITLLTMGHTVDGGRDRKGVYSLRNVNKLPKLRPMARPASAKPACGGGGAPAAQASLFAAPRTPAPAAPTLAALPTGKADEKNRKNEPEGKADTGKRAAPAARKGWFRRLWSFSGFLKAGAGILPRTAARLCGRLRSPKADARPRAQAELALEKVTVLRNDLSEADLVVVAVERKPEDSRSAQPPAAEPGRNAWTRATARWIKLKNPAEGGGAAVGGAGGESRPENGLPVAERRAGVPQLAGQWAHNPPQNPC